MYNLYPSTVTSKGQATIPSDLRRRFGIRPGQKIYFEERENNLVILKPVDISALRGSIKSNIRYSDRKADKAVQKFVVQEYLKKFK